MFTFAIESFIRLLKWQFRRKKIEKTNLQQKHNNYNLLHCSTALRKMKLHKYV